MPMDPTRLQVSVQEQERWRRRMSVTVPAAVVREEEHRAAKQLASTAKLKGFRKGRVPPRVIESRFGGALRKEALDRLIGDAYRHALQAERLNPISEGAIEDVRYVPEQDLTFEVSFDVHPEIELGRLGGFSVARPAVTVEEDEVQGLLQRIREESGAWRPVDEGPPEDGNLVSVKILRLEEEGAEEREHDFVLGRGDAIGDIEAAIKTLEPGSESEFTITFPSDFVNEARQGASERVRITLVGRRELELPPLDDDLAKQASEFETLEELTAKIRERLEDEARERADATVRNSLVDLLIEANPFEVPVSMVDRYLDAFFGDAGDMPAERVEEVREQIRPQAERAVKRLLAIGRVAELQGLTATEEEIDARVEEIAAANDTSAAKVYAGMQKAGRLDSLERELTERKVFAFLTEQSEIT